MNTGEAVQLAVTAAREAGGRVRELYGNSQIQEKADTSPVTNADIAAQKSIMNHLAPTEYPVISEEQADDAAAREAAELLWIVDPLDGTTDFIQETGEFAVMIALVEKGAPAAAAVYMPVLGVLYTAQRGEGAYRTNDEDGETSRLHVSGVADMREARGVMSTFHKSEEEQEAADALYLKDIQRVGSIGGKFAAIAEGHGEVYFTMTEKTKQWDLAAPELILREAGGEVTDIYGDRYTYNRAELKNTRGIAATNSHLHSDLIRTLQQAAPPQ